MIDRDYGIKIDNKELGRKSSYPSGPWQSISKKQKQVTRVNRTRVFITGMGITSSLGEGVAAHLDAEEQPDRHSAARPLHRVRGNLFPAGEIAGFRAPAGISHPRARVCDGAPGGPRRRGT